MIKENSHEQIYTFDGTVCVFLFPASLKDSGQTAAEKNRTTEAGIYPPGKASGNLSGIIHCVSHCRCSAVMDNEIFLFNLCVDDWIASGDLRVKRPVEYYDVRHPLCADRCWGGVLCCRSDISNPQFFSVITLRPFFYSEK
uniref:IncF plasmid conjugative transfer protein TrbF n=1 Tax=Klebsiella pneumoniae TaxID=573 RepID=A0A8B0SU28_KLEPN|nr:IncF plasmid conjugative transfer protein TrbF [Klebsiella pneumoniae]